MDELFYELMEKKFGPVNPAHKTHISWIIQDTGWSDPKRPTWFDRLSGFSSEEQASEELKKCRSRDPNTVFRIVKREVIETYTY